MDKTEVLREMIAEKQRQIELYRAMIAEWERELGNSAPVSVSNSPNADSSHDRGKKTPLAGNPLAQIQGLVFFGKSQPEAAKSFLQMIGYPLSTQQILDGIVKGGVVVGGKDPKQNLYTILDRSKEFGRVSRGGIWGLTTWPGVVKKATEEAEPEEDKEEASK